MLTLPLLDEVTQDLAQDQNLLRIKKLLVYACNNIWETDSHRLNQYSLPQLIQTMRERAPTLDHLKSYLAELVKTLNKPAEYTLIANAIVNRFRKLYPELDATLGAKQMPYQAIAQTLEQDVEQARIKKLLLCACTHSWENDPRRLAGISVLDLVQELHELAPSLENLRSVLSSIVKTINRQAHYRLIANKIVVAMEPVYALYLDETLSSSESSPVPAVVEPPQPALNLRPPDLSDLFDLRLEIMKYTNPFRAKLLIFSTLHYPLSWRDESWTVLKAHELDDLLRDLCQAYPAIDALESRLNHTAKTLPEPNEYRQAAAAIARAMQSFYSNSAPALAVVSTIPKSAVAAPSEPTRQLPTANQADLTGQLRSLPLPDDEGTRQL